MMISSVVVRDGTRAFALGKEWAELAADAGAGDEDIAISLAVGGSTVYRTKRRFVESNLEAALSEEPRPGAERKLSGKEEGAAGGDRLLQSARGPRAEDFGVAGRGDDQA
jgi:hypothetical protein